MYEHMKVCILDILCGVLQYITL